MSRHSAFLCFHHSVTVCRPICPLPRSLYPYLPVCSSGSHGFVLLSPITLSFYLPSFCPSVSVSPRFVLTWLSHRFVLPCPIVFVLLCLSPIVLSFRVCLPSFCPSVSVSHRFVLPCLSPIVLSFRVCLPSFCLISSFRVCLPSFCLPWFCPSVFHRFVLLRPVISSFCVQSFCCSMSFTLYFHAPFLVLSMLRQFNLFCKFRPSVSCS